MYDLIVDGYAGAGGEPAVTQKGRHRAGFHNELMHTFVYLPGGHTGGDRLARDTARAGGDLSGLTHQLDLVRGFNINSV